MLNFFFVVRCLCIRSVLFPSVIDHLLLFVPFNCCRQHIEADVD